MEKKLLFWLFMVSLFMCTQAEATVLTYNGWAGDNNNIADKYDDAGENYGSRISSSTVTYHETGVSDITAVFTQGNGWTPNIELTWGGGQPDLWDTYTGWAGEEVAQIQGSSPGNPQDLVFTPDAGYGVLINSFDLDEWAGGGGIVLDWKVSDATGILASGTWIGDNAGTRSTVNTGLTIDDMTIGNIVTLSFEQTAGDGTYLAMDDTNFDQFGGEKAANPSPVNEAIDVPREVVLSWMPGIFAAPINGHKVYIGENFNDVNDGIGGIAQDANSYALPQRLDFGTTYYWRIDEVNAPPDSTIFKGDVWSFTIEPFAYPIDGANITATASSSMAGGAPERTIDGSGLDDSDLHSTNLEDMWLSDITGPQPTWIEYQFDKVYKLQEMSVWNQNQMIENAIGYGFKDVSIEYSVDGVSYTTLGTTHEFARGLSAAGYAANTTVDFAGAVAKYVRLTANSNWGGILDQYGLSEVQFLYIPVFAREPNPASGATDVDVDVVLGWRAGRESASHDVYLSADPDVLTLAGPVTDPAFDTASLGLDLGQTYYWRVNEVNNTQLPASWQGDLWSFTTQEYRVVENFEFYNDIDPPDPESHTIFDSWSDGYLTPTTNGALVGYEPPQPPSQPSYMEHTIVYDGDQSMPFSYNNTIASYSEASVNTDDLAIGRDWTKGSPTTMLLRFYGDPNNAVTEQLYVKIGDTRFDYTGDVAELARPRWSEWPIDLRGMDLSNVTELAIGFDRLGGVGGQGTVLIDAVQLVAAPTMVPITVLDAGFDDHVLNNPGDYVYVGDAAYTGAWKSLFSSDGAWLDYGYYAADGDLPARSGNNKVYGTYTADDYIYQILDETFVEGVTYTLSVWVGIAWSGYDDNWSLYFTGEDHVNNLSETSGSAPVGSWGQVSLVYTATAADAGKRIGIKMKGAEYVSFEDVTLFQSAPAVTLQPDPEENLTVNPSFESPDLGPGGTGQWADYVDNWIIGNQGDCYLEDGSWEIVAPDGVATLKMWSGAAIWQQIGNVSPNTDYEISMFIGRDYDTSAVQVDLWASGDPSALPASYGVIGDTVGTTLIGGASLTPTIKVGQSELMGLSLNTGAGFGSEDALWIRIESIGGGGTAAWVDNVMVTIP